MKFTSQDMSYSDFCQGVICAGKETALAIPAKEALYDAPGQYVLQRHKD